MQWTDIFVRNGIRYNNPVTSETSCKKKKNKRKKKATSKHEIEKENWSILQKKMFYKKDVSADEGEKKKAVQEEKRNPLWHFNLTGRHFTLMLYRDSGPKVIKKL